jgi:zinc transporter ZupT
VSIGVIGILIEAGWTYKKSMILTVIINSSLVIGASLGLALGALNKTVSMCTSLYVSGAFLYLALTLLMPGIKK